MRQYPQFGFVPHPWALPIEKNEMNITMNLSKEIFIKS
jgi:hypothetical protein